MPHPILDSPDPEIFRLRTTASGPSGKLPFSEEFLAQAPSGDLFGWTQNTGMGWDPRKLTGNDFLLLSTQGGIRNPDGSPTALGFHTGHWEVGLLMEAAARELAVSGGVPFAAFCSDPCDGRTQGTTGMFDSLPYRNDAAMMFRRQIRSLPTAKGLIGIATCDKGMPAMMMALAGTPGLPVVLVPGGVSLISEEAEDLGKIQTIGARFAHGEISLEHAAEQGCRACGSPGGGCQFLGTAASSQVVGEALGLSLPHSALCPSGATIWRDMAVRSARALLKLKANGLISSKILSPASLHNAMALHAAFGGSTNLILHVPAIAHAAGLPRPTVSDWTRINQAVPRLVDALPNGPRSFATVQVFLAGGVPEVMLHLREAGLLELDALTVSGETLGANLDWWERSERRQRLRDKLHELDGIDPEDVIMSPAKARERGLNSTVTFLTGNLCPDGALIKSTAIAPDRLDANGRFFHMGPARVFPTEKEAIAAVKEQRVAAGDILVVIGLGPVGCGMPETYQLTSALKYLPFGKSISLITDGRFSGVSTGACIGHISPEAWADGPIGKLRDGDPVRIEIDTRKLIGTVDYVGPDPLEARTMFPGLVADARVPSDTRLWAALQNVSGGTWGGCVYDVEAILAKLR
ncbi:MAG: Dihydroxyacid dehydratase/phosphogluconate dehydratase [Verrucomicrobia bacterium]|nr:MAG: Dihydroxyacid dehydratase/phosphogluconate dehydratase [Verrucomicrobiota bacterium]